MFVCAVSENAIIAPSDISQNAADVWVVVVDAVAKLQSTAFTREIAPALVTLSDAAFNE